MEKTIAIFICVEKTEKRLTKKLLSSIVSIIFHGSRVSREKEGMHGTKSGTVRHHDFAPSHPPRNPVGSRACWKGGREGERQGEREGGREERREGGREEGRNYREAFCCSPNISFSRKHY